MLRNLGHRLKEAWDWAERLHFGHVIWEGIKGVGWSTGGGIFMSAAAGIANWSGFAVFFAGVTGFAAVAIGYVVVGLYRLNRNVAGQKTAQNDGFEWKSASDAIEAFAETNLIAARDDWLKKMEQAHERVWKTEDAIRDIQKNFGSGIAPPGSPEAEKLARHRKLMPSLQQFIEHYKEGLGLAWQELHNDINKKLCTGSLVAKGFPSPHQSGNAEAEIPAAEWRILWLDYDNSQAITNNVPEIVIYSGVVIRKAMAP
jgi:hypothetical protein